MRVAVLRSAELAIRVGMGWGGMGWGGMRTRLGFREASVLVAAAAGLSAGACSNMPSWADVKLPSASTFIPANTNSLNRAALNTGRPVAAADLVDAQGACAEAAPSESEGQSIARGVSLDMTECQVVQALGAPEATDIVRNEQGDRTVTLTYLRSERAGLYRFVRGRLVSIERAPGAEPSPEKQAPRNRAKKPQPS